VRVFCVFRVCVCVCLACVLSARFVFPVCVFVYASCVNKSFVFLFRVECVFRVCVVFRAFHAFPVFRVWVSCHTRNTHEKNATLQTY